MSPTKKILITSTPKSTKTRKLSKQQEETSDYDDDDGNYVKKEIFDHSNKTTTN